MIKGTLEPEFNHSKVFSFNSVRDEHLDFFDHGCITLILYGNQEDVKPDPRFMKMSTKVTLEYSGSTDLLLRIEFALMQYQNALYFVN